MCSIFDPITKPRIFKRGRAWTMEVSSACNHNDVAQALAFVQWQNAVLYAKEQPTITLDIEGLI